MSWIKNLFTRKKTLPSVELAEETYLFENVFADRMVELRKIEGPDSTSSSGLSNNQKISAIKRIRPRTLNYAQMRTRAVGAEGYLAPEYDLAEVGVVEDVESFVRQATYKKVALMYKEGFDFVSKNPRTLNYVSIRLAQIARASDTSTNEMLRNIGSSIIRMSNAFLVKQRDVKASGGKERVSPEGKNLKPIAAYFPVPAETMRVKLNAKNGAITGWRQEMPDGQTKDYSVEDVVHFSIRRKDGFVFGTPDLIPVMDDIRALRNMEETIELLVHKHSFPLFQYIVGTEDHPAGLTEDGQDEVELARQTIENMPAEGGIVTPERHKIEAIGAEGRALRGEGYLTHFKRRVIAGLGVSIIDLGEADSANRATARTLSRQLIDTVKDIQDSIEEQFNEKIIAELLQESTFAFDTLEAKNKVRLQFREIDIENRIEQEKHAAEMFEANGLTYPEFRMALGKEPIEVPLDPEDQDPAKYPDWHQIYWKLFGEPEQIIRAVDEAFTPQAKAAAMNRSLSVTGKELDVSSKEQQQQEKQKAEEDRKTKIAVTKARPKPTTTAKKSTKNFLEDQIALFKPRSSFKELESDIIQQVKNALEDLSLFSSSQAINRSIQATCSIWAQSLIDELTSVLNTRFLVAFNKETKYQAHLVPTLIQEGRRELEARCSHYLNKLANDIYNNVWKVLSGTISTTEQTPSTTIKNILLAQVRGVFSSFKYRIDFINWAETHKATSYGRLFGMKYNGVNGIQFMIGADSCEICQSFANNIFHPDELTLDTMSPFHSACTCYFEAAKKKE